MREVNEIRGKGNLNQKIVMTTVREKGKVLTKVFSHFVKKVIH